jgi:hypothetical protein
MIKILVLGSESDNKICASESEPKKLRIRNEILCIHNTKFDKGQSKIKNHLKFMAFFKKYKSFARLRATFSYRTRDAPDIRYPAGYQIALPDIRPDIR